MTSPASARTTKAPSPRMLLGSRSVAAFLRGFWHKEALLVRGALPDFAGLFTTRELIALALRDDVESRLVVRDGARWTFEAGPFRRSDFKALPERNWTLLVQGVNLHSAAADALLRRFAFLPYARLDDLMVSLAAPGGGVGPHFDSYDVFLLQGPGRRRWRYGRQDDLTLKRGLPVKILRRFAPQHDAILAPGDMLYLPPQFAHDGVAIDACATYSIGFRAASATEMGAAFLDLLRDELALPGRYADPDLAPTREPAWIGGAMLSQCAQQLAGIRWDRATIARFLGTWLSEPKPTVFFDPPAAPLSRAAFLARAARCGVRLDRRTQLLYDDRHLFVNGAALPWPAGGAAALKRLANERRLDVRAVAALPAAAASILWQGYRDGYLDLDS
ncbi:MAG: cupin domain-containing protein [Betaproteobacteria bacterium]